MENKTQRKWQIRATVLAIFFLGFLAGALTLRIYDNKQSVSSLQARRERVEKIMDRLNLAPEQRTQVNQILNETRQQFIDYRKQSEPRFSEIRKQTNERLQAVLTPEQWQQWQDMTHEGRPRRR